MSKCQNGYCLLLNDKSEEIEHGYERLYSSNKAAPKRGSEDGLPSGSPRAFVSMTSFLTIF